MLIACVQSDVSLADPAANLSRVLDWMERASQPPEHAGGSDLVVFPECMLTGYAFDSRDEAFKSALETSDPVFAQIAQHANRLGQLVTIGFLERRGQQLFNAAALIGPDGIIGVYHKIHLPHLGIDRFVDPGTAGYQPVDAIDSRGESIRIGLAICYDASFPEPSRVLALRGADVIALGTNWPVEANHTPEVLPPARSFENHLYFVAANRVGTENGFSFCGRSSICGPDGVLLAKSDDDQEVILFADVDLGIARNKEIVRTTETHVIHRFNDRRPAYYTPIIEPINSRHK